MGGFHASHFATELCNRKAQLIQRPARVSKLLICAMNRASWGMAIDDEIIVGVRSLLAVLRTSAQPLDVYVTQEGRYALTYGGGFVAAATVKEALEAGHLAETWPGSRLPHWRLPELGSSQNLFQNAL
jgi:hypothetical protein